MIVVDMIGWACAVAVLVAYALVLRTPAAVTGRPYLALNVVGSAGLAASGASHAAWPSAVLNLLWLGLAVHGVRNRRTGGRGTGRPARPPDRDPASVTTDGYGLVTSGRAPNLS